MKMLRITLCAALIAVAGFATIHQTQHVSKSGPIVVADDPFPIPPITRPPGL